MSGFVSGRYQDSPTAYPDGSDVQIAVDAYGNLRTVGAGANGGAFSDTVTLTRTNNTDAYTAGDVVGAATGSTAALQFDIGPSGGGPVLITTVSLAVNITAVPSGMTSFRLHLYSVTPPSALGDNAAFDLPAGDRASYLGFVDLGSPVDIGSTLYIETNQYNKQVVVPSGGSVFGYLVTVGAFTPAASTVFNISLHSVGL